MENKVEQIKTKKRHFPIPYLERGFGGLGGRGEGVGGLSFPSVLSKTVASRQSSDQTVGAPLL